MVEKINCPRLNAKTNYRAQSNREVFVRFNSSGNPVEIMCDEYVLKHGDGFKEKEDRYVCVIDKETDCIFKKWKPLR